MTDLRISLNRPQAMARRLVAPRTTLALPWGRGCGKSEFERLTWFSLVAQWDGVERKTNFDTIRGVRIVHMMPTFKQFRDTYAAKVEAAVNGRWAWLGGKINHTSWRIEFPGGSYIQPFSSEAAENQRSTRCDVVTVDEADDIDKEIYDAIVIPWMSENWSLQTRVVSGTPKRGRSGLLYRMHKLGLQQKPGYRTLHATYRDAPETVDARLVAEARETFSPATFAREWECDFDSAEGLVYPMFSDDIHVREPSEGTIWREFLVGGDHGWNDPGVFLVIGVAGSGRDTVVHVLEEVYEPQRTQDWWIEQAKRIVSDYEGARWYLDPSRPDTVNAYKREAGIRSCETNNAIESGVSTVANFMAIREREDGSKATRLFVHPRCKNLIREFGEYRYKKDARSSEIVTDDIIDRSNHAQDSLRYALHSRLGSLFSATRRDSAEESYSYG